MAYSDYTNIGLRMQDGGGLVHIGAKTLTTEKLRILKGVTTYGIPLVSTGDADASNIRVYDGATIKALPQINYPTVWADATEHTRTTGWSWVDLYTFGGLYKDSSVSTLTISLYLKPSDNAGCRVVVARARCEALYSASVSEGCHNSWVLKNISFDISTLAEGLHSWYIQWYGYKTGDADSSVYIKDVNATLT